MLDANNSKEGVFEIQNVQDGRGSYNTRGNGFIRWCSPRKINLIQTDTRDQDGLDFGWGWWCPTDFLVNSYEEGDPRYKATVLEESDSILCSVSSDGGIAWRSPNYNVLRSGTGLYRNSRKYECSYEEYWQSSQTWGDGPINMKVLRYADVVLFAAEANLELGNQSKALEYINMVRKRARMSGETNKPEDLSSVTKNDIVNERLVELAMEGHRFFDLVRWNLGDQYLNHELADGDQISFVKGKHEFFPIPDKEIIISKGILEQNPGY